MNKLKDYELERYNELKEIINNHEFYKVGKYVDYNIIKNTDLKDKLLNIINNLEIKKYDYTEILSEICQNVLSKEELNNIMNKMLYLEIEIGNIYEDSLQDKDMISYIYNKFKDPNYYPILLPDKLLEDNKFIEYCIKHKNYSIYRYIELEDKYHDIVMKDIKNGYGFICPYELPKDISIELIKNGYINSFDYYEAGLNDNIIFNYLKDIIDKDKRIIKSDYTMLKEELSTKIFDYAIETKKYKYLELLKNNLRFSKEFNNRKKEILSKLVKEDKEIEKYIYRISDINDEKLGIKCALNNSNYFIPNDILNRNKEYICQLLKQIDLRNLNNPIIIDAELIELIVKLDNKELYDYIYKYNINNYFVINNYINQLNNGENKLVNYFNKNYYEASKNIIAAHLDININNLDKFVSLFGYISIRYLNSYNIINTLKLDEENFNKYIDLFNIEKLNIEDVKNIYDSILQSRFKNEYKPDIERFAKIKLTFNDKSGYANKELYELASNTKLDKLKHDLKKINKLNNTLNNINNTKDLYEYLIKLYNEIKNGINVDKNIEIIYLINRQNIKNKREEFREKHKFDEEIKLDFKYEEKSLKDALVMEIYGEYISKNDVINALLEQNINYEIIPGVDNYILFDAVMSFLKKDFDYLDNYILKKYTNINYTNLKSNIKRVKEILGNYSELKEKSKFIDLEQLDQKYNINKIYFPKYKEEKVVELLSEINPYELRDTVFNNKDIFNSLKNLINKYKFIYWQDTFKKALSNSKFEYEYYMISALISRYNEIYQEIINNEDEHQNLMTILNLSDVLSSSSDRYSLLLGLDNARLIKLNPKPNNSPIMKNREERLEIAAQDYYKIITRKEITVPPISKVINIDDRQIEINLGNFSNPMNLTYGEKTGACMRINGVAHSLYEFCIKNPNGFHIRLTNPKNNNLISRVSGYRNGNSIFLNQLKETIDTEYTNDDLIKTMKVIADILIESTKNSASPIENIFISNDYAMSNSNYALQNIEGNIQEGFNTFYFDYFNNAICLKTTSTNNNHKPINTDKSNIETYKVLRDKIIKTNKTKEIYDYINQYKMKKDMIDKKDPNAYIKTTLINLKEVGKIIYLIKGEDFIAYIDNELNIIYDTYNKEESKKELENAILKLNKKKEEIINSKRIRR